MNGDPKKPQVAAAQAYFAAIAETFHDHLEASEGVDRVVVREEVAAGEKSLSKTAQSHGVDSYAFFHNAGYMGMYNMSLSDLKQLKGLPLKDKLIDRMGKVELAAHLFRVTQTDQKIQTENVRGQRNLESTAHTVGATIRRTILELGGKAPEALPLAPPIAEVKKALKDTGKKFKAMDSGGSQKELPLERVI